MFSLFSSEKKTSFVAVGDIVIDAFIRLQNAIVVPHEAAGTSELCMPFGDKVPFEFAEELPAVGNSANAAVCAARLGLDSALMSNVGVDQHGDECIAQLKKEHVGTGYVMRHNGLKTNYHYVLWFGQERTILIKHENFPLVIPPIGDPDYLYLSSLGENSLQFHTVLADYLDAHPKINLIFQPGTFQMKFGTDALTRIYKRSKMFFCNLEEAERILGIQNRDIKVLLNGIRALGPQMPVITDGPKGAYTFISSPDGDSASDKVVFMPAYPDPKPPYERTGAGDAFSSTFAIAIALGESVETALKWGSANATSVCEYIGAQKGLLHREELEKFVASAPVDWKMQILS